MPRVKALWYALVGLSIPSLLRDLGYVQTKPEWELAVLIFDASVLLAVLVVSVILLIHALGGRR